VLTRVICSNSLLHTPPPRPRASVSCAIDERRRSAREAARADHDTSASTSNLRFPVWQLEYQAALLEVDPQKLRERVKAAEAAIFLRQQALGYSSDGHAERQAIEDAMRALRFIKTEKLGYPDWNKK
jgi:hypothetical protein